MKISHPSQKELKIILRILLIRWRIDLTKRFLRLNNRILTWIVSFLFLKDRMQILKKKYLALKR
jgi:hypothetical protein